MQFLLFVTRWVAILMNHDIKVFKGHVTIPLMNLKLCLTCNQMLAMQIKRNKNNYGKNISFVYQCLIYQKVKKHIH